MVCVEIADDGPGIPPGERDKLFMPYYSTKRRGSGLGLAIVNQVVTLAGGFIQVDSTAGQGTRVRLYLPRIAASEVTTVP